MNKNDNEVDKKNIMFEYAQMFKKAMSCSTLDSAILKKRTVALTSYSKEDVERFLLNPKANEKQLRSVASDLYTTCPQFTTLVSYLPSIALLNYTIAPNLEKLNGGNINKFKNKYVDIAKYLEKLNIKHEFAKGLYLNFLYDVFYGYEIETKDSYFIKPLNPDYCKITSIEDGCYNYSFDFTFFKGKESLLEAYPEEFKQKYEVFKKLGNDFQWQELDGGKTICVKFNEECLDVTIPPYIGLFNDLYDIADFKSINKAKVESDNYKLIALKIPMDTKDGTPDKFLLSLDSIGMYMSMLESQIPEGVGFFPTPLEPQEMTFKQSGLSDKNEVANATKNLFISTGFASALFGDSDNATTLGYSTKVDEAKLFKLYRQYERFLNRKLRREFDGLYTLKILDMTLFNQDKIVDMYVKTAQISVPVKTLLASSVGITPYEMIGNTILENEILNISDNWKPLSSTFTQSGKGGEDVNKKAGRKKVADEDLGEAGIKTRENDGNNEGGL